jgi:hypothetical protein
MPNGSKHFRLSQAAVIAARVNVLFAYAMIFTPAPTSEGRAGRPFISVDGLSASKPVIRRH